MIFCFASGGCDLVMSVRSFSVCVCVCVSGADPSAAGCGGKSPRAKDKGPTPPHHVQPHKET